MSWPTLDEIALNPIVFYRKKTEPKIKEPEKIKVEDEPYGEESILPIDIELEPP